MSESRQTDLSAEDYVRIDRALYGERHPLDGTNLGIAYRGDRGALPGTFAAMLGAPVKAIREGTHSMFLHDLGLRRVKRWAEATHEAVEAAKIEGDLGEVPRNVRDSVMSSDTMWEAYARRLVYSAMNSVADGLRFCLGVFLPERPHLSDDGS